MRELILKAITTLPHDEAADLVMEVVNAYRDKVEKLEWDVLSLKMELKHEEKKRRQHEEKILNSRRPLLRLSGRSRSRQPV